MPSNILFLIGVALLRTALAQNHFISPVAKDADTTGFPQWNYGSTYHLTWWANYTTVSLALWQDYGDSQGNSYYDLLLGVLFTFLFPSLDSHPTTASLKYLSIKLLTTSQQTKPHIRGHFLITSTPLSTLTQTMCSTSAFTPANSVVMYTSNPTCSKSSRP